jgi:lysozyme family protein
MQQDYQAFVERMIARYEGGYGWDRRDPGGPTKFGITCYDLAEYLGEKMNSMSAWAPRVKAMTLATADEIYKKKYATACQFDALNAGCDCVVFDFGVNSGSSRAIKYSQMIVSTTIDGVLGPFTLKAINAQDQAWFVNQLCSARLAFLQKLGTWSTFGRGWTARVQDLRKYSLALLTPPSVAKLGRPERKEPIIPLAFAKGISEVERP